MRPKFVDMPDFSRAKIITASANRSIFSQFEGKDTIFQIMQPEPVDTVDFEILYLRMLMGKTGYGNTVK